MRAILLFCTLLVSVRGFAVLPATRASKTALNLELPVDPLVLAAGGLAVIGGIGAVVITGKIREMDGAELGSAPSATAAGTTVDISIPYDAAAKLAYDAAGSPGDYEAFKTKYEADAVADVKKKQK